MFSLVGEAHSQPDSELASWSTHLYLEEMHQESHIYTRCVFVCMLCMCLRVVFI